MKSYALLMLMVTTLFGCSFLQKKQIEEIDPAVVARDNAIVSSFESDLDAGKDPRDIQNQLLEFQRKNPASVFFQKSRLLLGRSLAAQEKWLESIQVYRDVISSTREAKPEIAALALYYGSFSHEALEDDSRVLANLLEAYSLRDQLPADKGLAEIPARLAMTYQRMGQDNEAAMYSRLAEQGLSQARAQSKEGLNPQALARIYFQMGAHIQRPLTEDTLQASMASFARGQIYLLKSVEVQAEPWSSKSKEALLSSYSRYIQFLEMLPLNVAFERGAAERDRLRRQIRFAEDISEVVAILEQYQLPEGSAANPLYVEVKSGLESFKKVLGRYIFRDNSETELTLESQKKRNPLLEGIRFDPIEDAQ
jgi:hypothetical protein